MPSRLLEHHVGIDRTWYIRTEIETTYRIFQLLYEKIHFLTPQPTTTATRQRILVFVVYDQIGQCRTHAQHAGCHIHYVRSTNVLFLVKMKRFPPQHPQKIKCYLVLPECVVDFLQYYAYMYVYLCVFLHFPTHTLRLLYSPSVWVSHPFVYYHDGGVMCIV